MFKKLITIGRIMGATLSFSAEKNAQLSILPGISLGAKSEDSISKFSFNLLGAKNENVKGLDLSLLELRTVEGDFTNNIYL